MKSKNKSIKRPKNFIGVDVFSGSGGLSLGAEMAGVDVKFAVEVWPSAAATYKRNHPNSTVINKDIQNIDSRKEIYNDGGIFVIMGGPPCQGFSMSNQRGRTMENPKNQLFKEFVRFVKELNPDWFVFENVYGIINMEKGEVIKNIAQCFKDLGYQTSEPTILWANDYGVPQRRNRCFIVGNKVGVNFEFPKPMGTHITVKEALEDLPILKSGDNIAIAPYRLSLSKCSEYAKLMRRNSLEATQNQVSLNSELVLQRYSYIKQGGNWRQIPEELMSNYEDKTRCHSGIYKRLREDEPSVVISNYRKMMLIHPTQDRGLSVREAARLQSFPDDFYFEGPISHIQQQIGNAVPPLLAKAIFKQILSYYE
ncbi:DNA cytosine methyltransferase [Phocaeicola barnesiae]|jgi:DNA (cytosine-5)-methyltransferase 1|uniref:DNA cytosine methyltransferase n=1 Tax=Phocaeicola barnesiae TaxID=376804 RepID=UPI0025A3C7BB|nr:DNA cytosine methyltransferase [Phocaeicola barnesiae]MDM8251017.1 DNA cytosine methyltransferase [Phocaeicola barnesiae]